MSNTECGVIYTYIRYYMQLKLMSDTYTHLGPIEKGR